MVKTYQTCGRVGMIIYGPMLKKLFPNKIQAGLNLWRLAKLAPGWGDYPLAMCECKKTLSTILIACFHD